MKKGNPDRVAHTTLTTDDARSKTALIRSDAQQTSTAASRSRVRGARSRGDFCGVVGSIGRIGADLLSAWICFCPGNIYYGSVVDTTKA